MPEKTYKELVLKKVPDARYANCSAYGNGIYDFGNERGWLSKNAKDEDDAWLLAAASIEAVGKDKAIPKQSTWPAKRLFLKYFPKAKLKEIPEYIKTSYFTNSNVKYYICYDNSSSAFLKFEEGIESPEQEEQAWINAVRSKKFFDEISDKIMHFAKQDIQNLYSEVQKIEDLKPLEELPPEVNAAEKIDIRIEPRDW